MPQRRVVPIRPGEANTGHKTKAQLRAQVIAPSMLPVEPDWSLILVDDPDAQATAHAEWEGIVPELHKLGILAGPLDLRVCMEYCIVVARVEGCERDISRRGLIVAGQKDGSEVRNQSAIMVNQYRASLARLTIALGLSPHSRAGLKRPATDETADENPWTKHAK